jgi:hypothetical protein
LWFIQLVRILMFIPASEYPPDSSDDSQSRRNEAEIGKPVAERYTPALSSDSDSSASANIGTPSSALYGSIADGTPVETPAVVVDTANSDMENDGRFSDSWRVRQQSQQQQRPGSRQKWKVWGRFRKWFGFHVGIPVSLSVFFFASFALEVIYTSTPVIVNRYFDWNGAHAGTLLGGLSLSILPILFVSEKVARRYEERTILKVKPFVAQSRLVWQGR